MTTFDFAAFGVIFACIVISALRGLMGEVIAFSGWLIALFSARAFAEEVSQSVFASMHPREMAVVSAFALIYISVRVVLALFSQLVGAVIKKDRLSSVNRLLGGLLGAVKGFVIVSIAVLLCAFSDLPDSPDWQESFSASFFESSALWCKPYLPEFLAKQVAFKHEGFMLDGDMPPAIEKTASGVGEHEKSEKTAHEKTTGRKTGSEVPAHPRKKSE